MTDHPPSTVLLSPDEMQAIAKVASFIHNLNNPGASPILEFGGYFAWTYTRDGEVVAEMDADFPDLISLNGDIHE